MSSKKRRTKSSKSGTKTKRAPAATKKRVALKSASRKRSGASKAKKQAAKRSSAAQRGWETRRAKEAAAQAAHAQALARARATRERRNTEKLKRSVAARKGWQTRRTKTPAIRKFEESRKAKQKAELKKVAAVPGVQKKWDFTFYRYYDEVVFPISKLNAFDLLTLIMDLKRRGVRMFRYEREVPVNLLGESSVFGSPSGFASTEYFNLQHLTQSDIENGRFERGLPSIKSMRVPGIDYARKLILKFADMGGLPKPAYNKIKKAPVETRDSILSPEEWGYYLRYGKRKKKKGGK